MLYLFLLINLVGTETLRIMRLLTLIFSNLYQYVYHNILIGYYSNLTLIFAIQDCVYSLFYLLTLSFFQRHNGFQSAVILLVFSTNQI